MSYDVKFAGESASGYIVSGARTEKLCVPGQEWEVWLSLNCPLDIKPWTAVKIYEDGQKVLTGYTASVGRVWGTEPVLAISGLDTWKRAQDCWNTEEYVTGTGDTIQSLIRRFLDMAGLSYQFNIDLDDDVPAGLSILYQPVSEIVLDLCSALGLFVRVNEDGWVILGDVVSDGGSGDRLDDEIIAFDLMESDYRARNKVVVWGPRNMAIVRSDEPWAVVDHTMVYASPYCYDAYSLANVIWSNLHTTEKVKTVDHPGDPDRRVGQRTHIEAPDNLYDESDICTTLKSDYGKDGYVMQSIFGERCAIFGHGPSPIDGRDVIVATYECGVWRCYDIWAEGGPVWYPLNTGLETAYAGYSIPAYGAHNCNWFIRDPFQPNNIVFLLTKYGIYRTDSTDHNLVNWYPVLPNSIAGGTILKLKSTIAREGQYYFVKADGINSAILGSTQDRFVSNYSSESYGTPPYSYDQCPINGRLGIPPQPPFHGGGYAVGMSSWHYGLAYIPAGNLGGLAAWHKGDWGCTTSGIADAITSVGGPVIWAHTMMYGGTDFYSQYNGKVFATSTNCCIAVMGDVLGSDSFRPHQNGLDDDGGSEWLDCPSIHVPYKQTYLESYGQCLRFQRPWPGLIYISPGKYTRTVSGVKKFYPTKVTPSGVASVVPPWGDDDCNPLQGSIGTYTQNPNRVYVFNAAKPCRVAISDDEADSWSEVTSIPVKTSCFSGFPTASEKLYAGRHPLDDPTSPSPTWDQSDSALIYVSWDDGVTWHDVTGDLWTKTQALGLREDPYGNPLGTRGLVTIAPRYS